MKKKASTTHLFPAFHTWLLLTIGLTTFTGCERNRDAASVGASPATAPPAPSQTQYVTQSEDEDYQRKKEEALAYADKLYQQRLKNPPPREMRLPNYEAGPGNPLPVLVNYYTRDDRYPAYLLCRYDVKEISYRGSDEPKWFAEALHQVRELGPKKFPPITWIAVAIFNRGEHAGASTAERCFRVGAIFSATNVFDPSCKLDDLIANTSVDPHPFKYDLQQPTPGEQQRWMIVERHAATNHASKGPAHP